MKSKVSPATLAVILTITVLALGLLGWKYLRPASGGPSENLKGQKIDVSNLNPKDFEEARKEIQAANTLRNGNK